MCDVSCLVAHMAVIKDGNVSAMLRCACNDSQSQPGFPKRAATAHVELKTGESLR